MSADSKASHGFTLVEVMIVVAILGILCSIAIPSYQSLIVKSRRTDAQRILISHAQIMERYFTSNSRYTTASGGTNCGPANPAASDFYTYTNVCADMIFKISATPVPGNSQASDGILSVDNTNAREGKWTD